MTTATITQLCAEHAALTAVYLAAANLRQFPVPFDAHFELVGAVDQCRAILEPAPEEDPRSDWRKHVAAYPREEFLATFREAHATLHRLWSAAVGTEGYDKEAWKTLDNALACFARDASEKCGLDRSEPLL